MGEEDWAEFLLAFCRDWLCCLCSVWTPESQPDGALQVLLASVCNKSRCWQEKSAREWLVNVKMCVICQRASGIESGASCCSGCPWEISGSYLQQIGYCGKVCSVALFSSLLFSSLLFSSLLFSSLLFSSLGTVCTVIFVEGSGDIGLSNATNLESNFMEMRHAVTTNESVDCPILQHIQPDLMAICTYFTRWLIRTTSLVQIQYFMSCQFVWICTNDLHLTPPLNVTGV